MGGQLGVVWDIADTFFAASQLHMAYLYSSGLFKLGILGHSWRAENKYAFFGLEIGLLFLHRTRYFTWFDQLRIS